MLKDIKNTIRQSAIYGISRVASKSISFILLPLYTSIFTSQTIANINLLESFWQYLFTICLLAFETAIITFCAPEKETNKVKSILFTFSVILLTNAALFSFIGFYFSKDIALLLFKDTNLSNVTFYCFLISVFESLLVIPLTISRLHSNAKLYTIISVASLVINLIIQIYFLIIIKKGFEYIFIAKFAAPGLVLLFFLPYSFRYLKPYISTILIKDILKFSLPLMLASLLAILLNTVDRYILVGFVDKSEIAVYTIGYSIGSVTNFFIVSPFVLAFNVMAWKKISDPNAERFFTKTTTYLFFVLIFVSLFVSFFIPDIIKIFIRNPELWNSVNIIKIILYSNCVAALYYISIQSYYFKKKTDIIFYIFGLCLLFNIAANFIFIPHFGIYSAAIISVLSYVLLILLSYHIAKKIYYIKFETLKIIILSLTYIILSYFIDFLHTNNFYFDTLIKLIILISFPFILHLIKFYEPAEIKSIKGFLTKYLTFNINKT